MKFSRNLEIENLAGNGNLVELKNLLSENYTKSEINIALESAIAYSQIETAKYLLLLGAEFSFRNYQGVYYAVHNNEIEGLKFAIENGVDINVNNGMIINTSILTCINEKNNDLIKWILNNGADKFLLTEENIKLICEYGSKELDCLILKL